MTSQRRPFGPPNLKTSLFWCHNGEVVLSAARRRRGATVSSRGASCATSRRHPC
uniref:Uncharacterized protein n=1 Tax=Cruciviridae sp. TaxID=1955495 RepID=A0A1S6LVL3_9VIRU|nr:hypothetical protein [Cruciviridae sp.]